MTRTDDLQAELAKIDADLIRGDLKQLEQCVRLARRKKIYDELYVQPEKRKRKSQAAQSRKEAKAARAQVLDRAGDACEICLFECEFIIHVHHVVPVELGGGGDPDSLIALCPNCHAIIHTIASFAKNNRDTGDLECWLEEFLDRAQIRRLVDISMHIIIRKSK